MAEGTRWRGRRDKGSRAFGVALLVALLLHFPFVPTNVGGWVRFFFEDRPDAGEEIDGEAIIPIDFDFEPGGTEPAAPPAPERPPLPETDDIEDVIDAGTPPPKRHAVDAGVDGSDGRQPDADAGEGDGKRPRDAGQDAEAEAGVVAALLDGGSDAGEPAALVDGDGGIILALLPDAAPDSGPEDARLDAGLDDAGPDAGPTLKDPLVVAGGSSQIFGKNPNVQVWILGERIRKHELGAQFGKLLTTIPEWKGYFSGTQIDPIRDLDQLLIAGPQLRDSRKVVVMMYHHLPPTRVHDAVGRVVAASDPPGEWLKDTPVEAARFFAEKGERIFALVPAKKLLVLLPMEAKDQLGKLDAAKPMGKPGVGILASTITPANALKEVPIPIPASLQWVGVSVTPTDNGGADVVVEAIDGSPELAAAHAAEITQAIDEKRKIEGFGLSIEAFQAIPFVATGSRLKASTHLTRGQLKFVLAAVGDYLANKQAVRDQKEKERKDKERKEKEQKDKAQKDKAQKADAGTAPNAKAPD